MEDKQIVQLYWDRDETAISETQTRYGNYCQSIAVNILHDLEDAKEAVNDTWLAAWNAMPPHRPAILSTFLGKLARRISIDKWRYLNADKRGGSQLTLSLDELEECVADYGMNEQLENRILASSIDDFLATLKESERKVFVCRYWYFDPVADIAKRFNFTPSKVKMILKRNREKLKEHLIKEGILHEERKTD